MATTTTTTTTAMAPAPATTTWVDDVNDDVMYSDGGEHYGDDHDEKALYSSSAAAALADERRWGDAKVVVEHEVDMDGNRYEVTKKVLQRHEARETAPADLRARFAPFGKAKGDQSALVSHEPPLALEMGTADKFEREGRAEVKRLLHEVSGVDVKVHDADLALLDKFAAEVAAATAAVAAGGGVGAGGGLLSSSSGAAAASPTTAGAPAAAATWGAARGTRASNDHDVDVKRRIRVTNVSDDITEDNLRNIFSVNDCVIERLYMPRDADTKRLRGFAFITFREPWMVDEALKRTRYTFKNVVMHVSRAIDNKK